MQKTAIAISYEEKKDMCWEDAVDHPHRGVLLVGLNIISDNIVMNHGVTVK